MKHILILYSTVDGHTHTICEFIADKLKNYQVDMIKISDYHKDDFSNYDMVVIGASIRYGHHRPYVVDFVNSNRSKLNQVKTAFFSVNLVARKSEKNTAITNPYVIKFTEITNWSPDIIDVFAGKLDYSLYGFFDKMIIKLIMLISKGSVNSDKPLVYTDWERVEKFVELVKKKIN